jgi:phage terminase Nu1 subunit (DNA packaging protein)
VRLSQKELATLIGLTSRQVRNLTDAGMPSETEGNRRFYGPAAVVWYVEFKVAEERSRHTTGEREQLELDKMRHQNREARVKADLAERRVVLVEEVEHAWADACGRIRDEIMRIPVRHGDVVRPDDPAAGEEVLEQVADDVLRALQEALAPPELIEDNDPGDEVSDAA